MESILDVVFAPLLITVAVLALEISSNLMFRRRLQNLIDGPFRGETRVEAIVKFNQALNNWGRYSIGIISFGLMIFYVYTADKWGDLFFRLMYAGMYSMAIIVIFFNKKGNPLNGVRLRGMVKMIKRNFENGSKSAVEDLLIALDRLGSSRFKAVSSMGLEKWGSPSAMDALDDIHQSVSFVEGKDSKDVGDLASKAYNELRTELWALDSARFATYRPLLDKRLYWKRLLSASNQSTRTELDKLMDSDLVRFAPERLMEHHFEVFNHLDECLCEDCNTRGELTQVGKYQIARCRMCQEVQPLQKGARHVVGVIGPAETSPQTGKREIRLWDSQEEKPVYADVDELHIRAGDGFNYEWAIAAVIEQQINQRPEHFPRIKLEIDPALQLSGNTQAQLKLLVPETAPSS